MADGTVALADDAVEGAQAAPEGEAPAYAFPLPSAEEARVILREVEWGEHYVGVDMNPAAGNREVYIYSLKEAVKFLRYGTAGLGLSTGGKGSISWLDIDGMIAWIRDGLRDAALARAIEREVAQEDAFYGKVQALGRLVEGRYAQLIDAAAAAEDE